MNNKIAYLAQSLDNKVINFLEQSEDKIPNKLLVWFGREVNKIYTNNIKNNIPTTGRYVSTVDGYKYTILDKDYETAKYVVDNSLPYVPSVQSNAKSITVSGQALITLNDIIKDWFNAVRVNISAFSFYEAMIESIKWHIALSKVKQGLLTYSEITNTNIVYTYKTYKIVSLARKTDCVVEGNKMGHCVGTGSYGSRLSKNYKILSVRDEFNEPHATMEVEIDDNGDYNILQIKGKQNKVPILKYQPAIISWISTLNTTAVANCQDFLLFDSNQTLEIDGKDYDVSIQQYEYIGNNLN